MMEATEVGFIGVGLILRLMQIALDKPSVTGLSLIRPLILVWFAIDTEFSLARAVYGNVLPNCPAAGILVPLQFGSREHRREPTCP
jgi:hypothetical protein